MLEVLENPKVVLHLHCLLACHVSAAMLHIVKVWFEPIGLHDTVKDFLYMYPNEPNMNQNDPKPLAIYPAFIYLNFISSTPVHWNLMSFFFPEVGLSGLGLVEFVFFCLYEQPETRVPLWNLGSPLCNVKLAFKCAFNSIAKKTDAFAVKAWHCECHYEVRMLKHPRYELDSVPSGAAVCVCVCMWHFDIVRPGLFLNRF